LSNGVGCEAKIFWGRTSKEPAGPTPVKRGTSRQNFGSTLKNKLMVGCDAKTGNILVYKSRGAHRTYIN
jgi:hypothetical protein